MERITIVSRDTIEAIINALSIGDRLFETRAEARRHLPLGKIVSRMPLIASANRVKVVGRE